MTDNLYFGASARVNFQPNICMRTQFLQKLSALFCLGLALVGVNHQASGQLQVGPSGLAPQTFDALPSVSDWATLSVGPRVGGGVISSGTQMDTVVQTNPASTINLVLPTSSIASNSPSGFAQWNSVNHNLQTRADTNWYVALKATLRNNTGSNVVSVTVSYDLATAAGTGTISEQVPAHRVYYSFTGTTGTWVHIPEFDSSTAIDNSSKSASLNLGVWAPSALLYLLWADVNASGANTAEGGYSIDNFAVKAVPPQPGPPTITAQPQSQTVNFPNQVTFSVNANGSVPLFYQWFKDGTPISGATGSSYTIVNATVNDQGSYSVVVTNSLGTATSSGATLTVNCGGGTVPSITTQPADQSLASGGTISLSVVAAGTSPVYQWYRGGSAIAGATAATYTKAGAQGSDSGLYTVVVKNCAGGVTSREAVVSVSTPGYLLMGLTNYVWKYEQSGTDLGTAWRTNGYNDTAWPSGTGIFGFETDAAGIIPLIHTPLTLGTPQKITYYFRTTFVLSNDPATVSLVSSNYFDDGAVVYLNGVEAFRYNLPGGNVLYATLAPAANPAGEGTFIISNLPSSLLVQGQNLLAVEVHQNSTGSSDIDFGMALFVNSPAPTQLFITDQPRSLTVEETKRATFTVGVQGTPAYFQWYRNGVAISGATVNPFTIPSVSVADAGNYYVVVSNVINSATSSVATLTILSDTNAPTIVEADGTLATTNVLVSFSELVLPSTATNIANYKITNTLGGTLTISSAVLQNGTNILLRTAARASGSNYIVIVNNVRDTSPAQNLIAPNSMYPIRSLIPLIAMDSGQWTFIDPYPPFDTDPGAAGTGWKEVNYDTTGWSSGGVSVFYDVGDPTVISGPLGTSLGQTPIITSYFRKTFTLQVSPGGLQYFLTHLIDDGAVLYMNGTEFYRFNMPNGTVTTSTVPTTVIGDVSLLGPFKLSIPSTLTGANLLAAELHQASPSDDKVFGIQLDASVQSFVVGPVVIAGGPGDVTIPEGQPATFSVVQVGGSNFQWQQSNTNIPGATNATYTIPAVTLAMNGATIRVVVNGATTGATSTNATVHVVGDTNAPALVGAVLTTNGTVVVSFSEQVSAGSAAASNYRITNSSGASIPITGAALASGNSNVVLTVGSMPLNTYTLVVTNVQDRATVPNALSPSPGAAQIGFEGPQQLLGLGAVWKYDQSGADLGTAWRNVGYNDSGWASGPGMFGLETGTAEPEPIRTPWTVDTKVTYYLRTTVNSPAGGSRATLRVRFVLDDGAIFYLNGVEFQRVRIAGGPVNYTTLAANPPTEGVFEGFDVVVTNLVAGPNLIAVEVHQSSTASSDVVFGGEITLVSVESDVIQPPLQIVTQPQSQTANVGSTVSFNVVATGTGPLFYQWRKGGADIPNATGNTYTITNVQQSAAGSYSVRVANSFSSVTSQVATLTVNNGTGGCSILANWTNNLRFATNGTNAVTVTHNANVTTTLLSWTNPATNDCGSNATVVLQRALSLGNTFPVPSTVWTNIYTNVFGFTRITNSVTNNSQAYYRLRVP